MIRCSEVDPVHLESGNGLQKVVGALVDHVPGVNESSGIYFFQDD